MQFDTAVVFNSDSRNCLAVFVARIPTRVCWAYRAAGCLLGTHRVALRRSHPPLHEAEFALAFARRLGAHAELQHLMPHLAVDRLVQERIASRVSHELGRGAPLFAVHPTNKKSAYNWPLARYGELIERLALVGRVMVTGAAEEREPLVAMVDSLGSHARRRVAVFTDFNLQELIASLSLPAVLTVSSTGPMHIAGVLGTPVVALFSPHPAHVPAKWAPLGTQHRLLVAPLNPGEDPRVPSEQGDELMCRISVAEVFHANLEFARRATQLGYWSKAA